MATLVNAPPATTSNRPTPDRAVVTRSGRLPEITLIAVLALVGYIAAGWWAKYTYNFSLGDALARTLDARLIVSGRDPHAAAIGVYWMPLPTYVQVPLVYVLGFFGRPEFAGPLSTAIWGAGTVLVMGRVARDLGLPRATGFALTVAYALNPVAIYYAANGMSEGAQFFWISMTLWGLLRFFRSATNAGLVLTGVGLAGLVLTKYEAIPLVIVVAGIVTLTHLRRPVSRRYDTLTELVLTIGPALWALLLWFIYLKIITGSFTSFRTVAEATQGGGPAPGPAVTTAITSSPIAAVADARGNLRDSFRYVATWVAAFFPAALLLTPVLLVPPWRKMISGVAVLAFGLASIGATGYLVYRGGTYGNARYFTALVPIGAVAVILATSRIPLTRYRRAFVDPVMVGVLVLAGVTAGLAESEASQSVEQEGRVFGLLAGRYDDQPNLTKPTTDFSSEFAPFAARMDALLTPADRVLLDTRFTGPAALFSEHPKQLIVNADRDYEQIVAPTGLTVRIDYAVVPPDANIMGLPSVRDDAYQLVRREPAWEKVFGTKVAELWMNTDLKRKGDPYPPQG